MRWRITVVPYPGWVGALTAGPPLSRHSSLSFVGTPPSHSLYQRTDTWPPGAESAPYLAAFVVSSCSTMAIASVAPAGSLAEGPSTTVLPAAEYGASSRLTKSARLTPCQRLRLR